MNYPSARDIEVKRAQAVEKIAKSQAYQEKAFNAKHKAPRTYKVGELVMIRNYDTPGVSKKLLPKFRASYEAHMKSKRPLETTVMSFTIRQVFRTLINLTRVSGKTCDAG